MKRQPFGVGNPDAQAELMAAFELDGGSFLLLGPARTGKYTIARVFAQVFTCLEPKQSRPCGLCGVCQLRSTLPNVNILEAAARPLSIDAVRDLKAGLSMRPFIGCRRVVILNEFETATKEAQNALLKILEEPPAGVAFLLISSDMFSVLPTVQSRTRLIKFQPVAAEEILAWLTGQGVPSPEAIRASKLALGRPGLARWLISRPSASLTLETLRSFGIAKRFEEVRLAAKEATGPGSEDAIADWLLAFRSELLAAAGRGVSGAQAASKKVKLMRQLTGIARQLRQDAGAPAGLLLESFAAVLP